MYPNGYGGMGMGGMGMGTGYGSGYGGMGTGMGAGMGGMGGMNNNMAAQPTREPEVEKGVSFLSHDTVKNTSPKAKMVFLEQKGLTVHEIAEALRRVEPDSELCQAVVKGALSGQTASAAVAHLPDTSAALVTDRSTSGGLTPAAAVAGSSPLAGPPLSHVSHPTIPPMIPHQGVQAVPFYPALHRPAPPGMMVIGPNMYAFQPNDMYQPPVRTPQHEQQQQRRGGLWDWVLPGLSVIGAAATAAYFGRHYLPQVWTSPQTLPTLSHEEVTSVEKVEQAQQKQEKADKEKAAKQLQRDEDENNPLKGLGLNLGSSGPSDRFGLSQLNDKFVSEARQDVFTSAINDMKTEISDVAGVLKEQSQDIKRALIAMQASLSRVPQTDMADNTIDATTSSFSSSSSSSSSSSVSPSTAVPGHATSPPPPVAAATTPSIQVLPDVQQSGKALQAALQTLLQEATESQAKGAINTMKFYISNILKSPTDTKYRKITRSNAHYKNKVGSVKGGDDFLKAAGFEGKGSFMEVPMSDDEEHNALTLTMLQQAKEALEQALRTQQADTAPRQTVANILPLPPSSAAAVAAALPNPSPFAASDTAPTPLSSSSPTSPTDAPSEDATITAAKAAAALVNPSPFVVSPPLTYADVATTSTLTHTTSTTSTTSTTFQAPSPSEAHAQTQTQTTTHTQAQPEVVQLAGVDVALPGASSDSFQQPTSISMTDTHSILQDSQQAAAQSAETSQQQPVDAQTSSEQLGQSEETVVAVETETGKTEVSVETETGEAEVSVDTETGEADSAETGETDVDTKTSVEPLQSTSSAPTADQPQTPHTTEQPATD